jgi:undecaprenyl phosphate-alpha-L-ara4N flippase subunit ArnE
MTYIRLLIPAALACACNAAANTLWKIQFSKVPLSVASISAFISSVFTFKVILGAFLYCGSMVLFFYLLSHYKMSQVVPVLALTYVFNLLAAYFVLHENVSVVQVAGICVILGGIFLYSRG